MLVWLTINEVQVMTIKDSFTIQGNDIEHDAIDDYFECITACSIDNEGMHCLTRCVEIHLKNEGRKWIANIVFNYLLQAK